MPAAPSPQALKPGDPIGAYHVVSLLGRGGMASVWRVEHRETGEEFALKLLLREQSSEEIVQRFELEYKTLSQLEHPHIVKVYEQGVWGGYPWFTMEYVDGMELKQAMKGWGRFSAQERFELARGMLIQLATALAYVHDRGLIHRDIKPGNIMVARSGEVRLMDFGVVKEPGADLTVAGEMIGTVAYIAPEQINAEGVDTRADLYSLGTVFYLMLTGRRPFHASTLHGYLAKHLHQRPRPPSELTEGIPEELSEACLRLLEKAPVDRFGSAHHLLSALGESAEPVEPNAAHRWPLRIVGRAREQSLLREQVANLLVGRGSVLLLEGPSGYGKSVLLDSIQRWARAAKLQVCRGVGSSESWSVFHDILKGLDCQPDAVPAVLQTGFSNPDAPVEHFQIHHAFRDLLRSEQPRVILIDDLEAADRGSLGLLDSLSRDLILQGSTPLLIAIARKPPEGRDPLDQLWMALEAKGALTREYLSPIHQGAVEELLLQVMPNSRGVKGFATRLHREGEGNPYFIVEMVRSLVDEGELRIEGSVIDLENTALSRMQLPVPRDIQEALRERIRLLSPAAQRLATFIALCRHEVTLEMLLQAMSMPGEHIMDQVDELLDAGIIQQREVGSEELFELSQSRLAKVLIEDTPASVRVKLHARAGMAMEQVYRYRLSSVVEAISHHFERGHMPGKAYAYLFRAGERLMSRSFMSEAMECFDRALGTEPDARDLMALDEADHKLALLRMRRGMALEHLGHWSRAVEEMRAAQRLARELNQPQLLCRVLTELGSLEMRRTRRDSAQTYLEEALRLAREVGSPRLLLKPSYMLGGNAWSQGDLEQARAFWMQTQELAEQTGDEKNLGAAYRGLGIIDFCLGNSTGARQHLERSCEQYESIALISELSISSINLVELSHCMGNFRKGLQLAERTIQQTREVGYRQGEALGLLYRGLILTDMGRIHEAQHELVQGVKLFRELGAKDDELTALAFQIRLAWRQGAVEDMGGMIRSARELAVHCDTEGYSAVFDAWWGLWCARRGDFEEADIALRCSQRDERQFFWSYQRVRLGLIRSRTYELMERWDEARREAENALVESEQCNYRNYTLQAHWLLSRLAPPEQREHHQRLGENLVRSLSANLGREDAKRFMELDRLVAQ